MRIIFSDDARKVSLKKKSVGAALRSGASTQTRGLFFIAEKKMRVNRLDYFGFWEIDMEIIPGVDLISYEWFLLDFFL